MELLKLSELNAGLIAEFARRNGAPWVRKFGALCIQEVLVATKSPVNNVRTSTLHVNVCEMSHFLARNPRHTLYTICVKLSIGRLRDGVILLLWPEVLFVFPFTDKSGNPSEV